MCFVDDNGAMVWLCPNVGRKYSVWLHGCLGSEPKCGTTPQTLGRKRQEEARGTEERQCAGCEQERTSASAQGLPEAALEVFILSR